MAQRYELDVSLDSSGVTQGAEAATQALGGLRGQAGLVSTALKAAVPIMAAYAGARGLGAVISSASQLESQMSELKGQVGLSSQEIQNIRQETMDLAATTGQATKQIAQGYKFARSAGLRLAKANELVETATKASAAGFGSQQDLVRTATTAMNAWKQEVESGTQFLDKLTKAAQNMDIEVAGLSSAFRRNVNLANQLNLSLDETFASLGAVAGAAGDASRGGRLFQQVLNGLLSPSEQAEEKINQVFGSVENLRKSLEDRGLIDTMVTLRTQLERSGSGLEDVFTSSRKLEGALALTADEGSRAEEILNNMDNAAGNVNETFNKTADSSRNWKIATQNVNNLMVDLGEDLLPLVNSGLQEFTRVVNNLRGEETTFQIDELKNLNTTLDESNQKIQKLDNQFNAINTQVNLNRLFTSLDSPQQRIGAVEQIRQRISSDLSRLDDQLSPQNFNVLVNSINNTLDEAMRKGIEDPAWIRRRVDAAIDQVKGKNNREMEKKAQQLWQSMVNELESLPSPIERAMDEKIMVGGVEFDLSRSSVFGQDQLEEFNDPFGNTGSVGTTPPEGFLDMDAPFSGIDEKLDEEAKSGAESAEMRLSQAARNVSFDFERNLAEGIRTGFDGGADIGESLLMDLADTASQNMAQGIMDGVTQGLMESTGEETIAGMTKAGLSGIGGWFEGMFFDTPGVQEVGPQGGMAGFAPGDKFVAGKSEKSMREQLSGGASGGGDAYIEQNVEFPVTSDEQIDRRIQKAAPRIADMAERQVMSSLRGGGPDAQTARNA